VSGEVPISPRAPPFPLRGLRLGSLTRVRVRDAADSRRPPVGSCSNAPLRSREPFRSEIHASHGGTIPPQLVALNSLRQKAVSHRHHEMSRVYAGCMRTRRVHHDGSTSAAGHWRSVAASLGVLALACWPADDTQGSSLPTSAGSGGEAEPTASGPNESFTVDDDTSDAGGSLPTGDSAECPALPPAHDSIECRCSLESCPSTLEEAEQSLCAVAGPFLPAVERHVGCGGVVVVFDNNGQSGSAWTFEPPSESGDPAPAAPRLVGAATFCGANSSDSDPCHRAPWPAGHDFGIECDYGPVVACQVCGDSPDTDYPPCQ